MQTRALLCVLVKTPVVGMLFCIAKIRVNRLHHLCFFDECAHGSRVALLQHSSNNLFTLVGGVCTFQCSGDVACEGNTNFYCQSEGVAAKASCLE